jgi:hypothetical protein
LSGSGLTKGKEIKKNFLFEEQQGWGLLLELGNTSRRKEKYCNFSLS